MEGVSLAADYVSTKMVKETATVGAGNFAAVIAATATDAFVWSDNS